MIAKHMFSRRYIAVLAVIAIAVSFPSCTKHFESYNTNKHEASEEMMSMDGLMNGAMFAQMQRNIVLFRDGINLDSDYQVSQGLTSDLYSGYIAPTGSWYSGVHNGSYSFITGWINKTFESSYLYVMSGWRRIVNTSEELGLEEQAAVATIVKVAGMHRVADAYGPIPYSKSGTALQAEYDSLEEIYNTFFEELDWAIEVLTPYSLKGDPIFESFDYVYGGNAVKWVKFANSLRLRLAMRVSYAAPQLAQQQAELAVSNVHGLITNKSERAALQHSLITYYHPLYEICNNFNAGEVRMSASMDSYLNGYGDPRIGVYFKEAANGGYHGVRLGIATSTWDKYVGDNISKLNMNTSDTEIVWMTAAEPYFLLAEAALRGWSVGGSAEDYYNQGIRVSMEENGILSDAVTTYIADSTRTPAAFTDNAESSSLNHQAPSSITIAWDEAAGTDEKLERIITQKWIAMYPDGPEGWAEFRRTGYPKLLPVVNNYSNSTINTEIQVRRIPYPQAEYDSNPTGVQSGINKLGGRDNGGTKLWWDQK